MNVIAYGLDYIRLAIHRDADLEYIQRELDYLDISSVWHHGRRFVDLTGAMLEVIRTLDDFEERIGSLVRIFRVSRLDVFIDVMGNHLDKVRSEGNKIYQGDKVETIYSHLLEQRGNVPIFARAYDAMAAGHYDEDVTRFEVEFHKDVSRAIVDTDGFRVIPASVALHSIRTLFGVKLQCEAFREIEIDAPKRKYEHNRERFYRRYGKGILSDFYDIGAKNLLVFIEECVRGKYGE